MADNPSGNTSKLTIAETADGSKTLFNAEVGEHYHSRHGALQESKHVFVESGLKFFLGKEARNTVNVLEVGFGTGLNFLLTADFCTEHQIGLNYTGIEAYPIDEELLSATGYSSYVSQKVWDAFLATYREAINQTVRLNELSSYKIAHCELLNFEDKQLYDVLYFDAFAAVHQPEMWSAESLAACTRYLKPGGVFVTYAITGNLKRAMKALNFSIEKAPGAPGKREMLRAVKNG